MTLPRRGIAAALVAVCLASGTALAEVPAAGPGGVLAPSSTSTTTAVVDPALRAAAALAPVPAVLAWDDTRTDRAAVEAHLRRGGVRFGTFSHLSMTVACAVSPAQVDVLAAAPGALSVWSDEQLTPVGLPTVTAPTTGPAAATVQPLAAPAGATGDGVGVAVLDTGVDGTHAALTNGSKTVLNARVLVSHLEVQGPGNDSCIPDRTDDGLPDSESVSGHGTYLAGVAAGGTAGVARRADVVGVSVAEQVTPEYRGDASASLIRFIGGVNYVLVRTLEGGPTTTKVALLGWTSSGLYDPYHPHTLAIRDLYDFGITVVVPVGNGGPEQSRCDAAETCRFNRLAVGPYVLGVGATSATGTLEDYSSRGDTEVRESREEFVFYEPRLVAPGTNVRGPRRAGVSNVAPALPAQQYTPAASGSDPTADATDPTSVTMTGTAVAAAQVAGAVALMQQTARDAKGCYLATSQVQDILEQTSKKTGRPRWQTGAGVLDVDAAVAAARTAPRVPSPDVWNCPPA